MIWPTGTAYPCDVLAGRYGRKREALTYFNENVLNELGKSGIRSWDPLHGGLQA